jgi:hypothetical protein
MTSSAASHPATRIEDNPMTRIARPATYRTTGYKLAVTTDWGSLQSAQRPFALKRLRILDTTGVSGLAAMLGDVG